VLPGKHVSALSKVIALLAVGAAGGAVAAAVASTPTNNGVIDACVEATVNNSTSTIPISGANLRAIDEAAGQTCNTPTNTGEGQTVELPLDWNVTGPQGSTGPQGPTGPQGSTGPQGAIDTVVGGSTLILPDKQVITIAGTGLGSPVTDTGKSLGKVMITGLTKGQRTTFEISSFQFGNGSSSDAGTGMPSGKRQHGPIVITKTVDAASPTLLQALLTNEELKTMEIVLPHAGGGVTQTVKLTNAIVVSEILGRPDTGKGESQVQTLYIQYQKLSLTTSK
jgi:type VI secretion system secreted protein Hcp